MSNKKVFGICLLTLVVLTAAYNHVQAENKEGALSIKIAVVSIKDVFQNSKRNADYKEQATKEQQEMLAELEKRATEVKALEAELKTLKPGSDGYMSLVEKITEKQAMLKAKQDFYQEVLGVKDQKWTEELYSQILQVTAELAKEKGLDLVLEKDDIELPAASSTELMLLIRTHKVLYSADELDITDQVTVEIDSRK